MKACYPGTFDPITNGHLDIIERASKMFEELVVLIMDNPRKKCTFSVEKRKEMIEKSLADIGHPVNVRVEIGYGLTVNYARRLGCGAIIRGIRAVSDYEYELQQATANLSLDDEVETLFFIARPAYSFLSSSVCKEIAMNGGKLYGFIPSPIIQEVMDELYIPVEEL
ncbi:pantetheine-phosphate adenylyltransferase [Bulleidia sp. zg-1006]|nr:pantetheine-phosphate adenylyltransferase [Trueperella sp. zg.1013]QRG87469.1 pantetheine-phosphate adenylyltransferase [Bulleidia sp. zg-1006]